MFMLSYSPDHVLASIFTQYLNSRAVKALLGYRAVHTIANCAPPKPQQLFGLVSKGWWISPIFEPGFIASCMYSSDAPTPTSAA